jgi:hypothetical protein
MIVIFFFEINTFQHHSIFGNCTGMDDFKLGRQKFGFGKAFLCFETSRKSALDCEDPRHYMQACDKSDCQFDSNDKGKDSDGFSFNMICGLPLDDHYDCEANLSVGHVLGCRKVTSCQKIYGLVHAEKCTKSLYNFLDEIWLFERCDGDLGLICELLDSFLFDGVRHIAQMHHQNRPQEISFHAV